MLSTLDIKMLASELPSALVKETAALEALSERIAFHLLKMQEIKQTGEYITKNQAYKTKEFGRKRVDEWIACGIIDVKLVGNRHLLEYDKLKELSLMTEAELNKRLTTTASKSVIKRKR